MREKSKGKYTGHRRLRAKKAVFAGFALVLLLVFCLSAPADERAAILNSEVLENFDDNPTTRWMARGSKFTTVEYDENRNPIGIFPKVAETASYPTSLFGFKNDKNDEGQDRKVLGIYGKFDRRGYNYVEIIPAKAADSSTAESDIVYEDINTGTKWAHAPLDIPGKVQYFDMWVWGSNYNYYLDAHFEDYRGLTYSFRLGNLNYAGWKNLRVIIPGYIPQSEPYIPKFKPLRFTKFVMWTRPEEPVSGFYLYIDHIKVLTDVYTDRFDGDDLANLDLTKQIWDSGSR